MFLKKRFIYYVLILIIFFIVLFQELILLSNFNNNNLKLKKNNLKLGNLKKSNLGKNVFFNFPIDAVYTWVNGSDSNFKQKLQQFQLNLNKNNCVKFIESNFVLIKPKTIPEIDDVLIDKQNKEWIPALAEIAKINSSVFYISKLQKVARKFLDKKPYFLRDYEFYLLDFVNTECLQSVNEKYKDFILHNLIKINLNFWNKNSEQNLRQVLNKLKVFFNTTIVNFIYDIKEFNIRLISINSKVNFKDIQKELIKQFYNEEIVEFGDFNFKVILKDLKSSLNNEDALSENRFFDKDELKYSLRSIEKFANWINNIYIVTNGQIPHWLNTSNPRIKIVVHDQIFTNKSNLPTFNSAAIEFQLQNIKGLSKLFLYFNDDFMFGDYVYPENFISRSYGFNLYTTYKIPFCENHCVDSWLNDGFCDKTCNTSLCLWDGGDCLIKENNVLTTIQTENQDLCSEECTEDLLKNDECDKACDNLNCEYDLGKCNLQALLKKYDINEFKDAQTIYKFNTQSKKFFILNFSEYLYKKWPKISYFNLTLKLIGEKNENLKAFSYDQRYNLMFILIKKFNIILKFGFSITIRKLHEEKELENIKVYFDFNTDELQDNEVSFIGRKLMNFYLDSLKYSNYLFNKKYEIIQRKVPAHVPILLDIDILERMKSKFSQEIEITLQNKIRSSNDLQFAFTYYYYLISETEFESPLNLLNSLDTDLNGKLNKNEFHTFLVRIEKKYLDDSYIDKTWQKLFRCFSSQDENEFLIDELVDCEFFKKNFFELINKKKKKNLFSYNDKDNFEFILIDNNFENVKKKLNNLRIQPKQFICLNDDLIYENQTNLKLIENEIKKFYQSILPLKSQFENI